MRINNLKISLKYMRTQVHVNETFDFSNTREVENTPKSQYTSLCRKLVAELKQCSNRRDLQRGKLLHSYAIGHGYNKDRYVAHTLISMYSKCGSMQEAREVFNSMSQHAVVSWNSLILGYVENGESVLALGLFTSMDCAPDSVTYVAALKACARLGDKTDCLRKGLAIHRQAREHGFEKDIFVASTLVDMYSKCNSMVHAREVFNGMTYRNAVSWTALISGYVENGESLVALEVFNSMDCKPNSFTFVAAFKACRGLNCLEKGMAIHMKAREFGVDRDVFVASTLVDMYSKCGSMSRAQDVFDRMVHRNAVSWTALILGYVENGECLVAFEALTSMDCVPDGFTFGAALKACAGLATDNSFVKKCCLCKGMAIHSQAREFGFDKHVFVANTLVEMYGRCGSMKDARSVFDSMGKHYTASWNSLMLGYVENGESLVALDVFNSMNCAPDSFTFVTALKASVKELCVENGMAIHRRAVECGFEKEVFVASAIVDMYIKCGLMRDAQEAFESIVQHSSVAWNSLMLGYVETGEYLLALDVFTGMDCAPDEFTFSAALKACASLLTRKEMDRNVCIEKGMAIHRQAREQGFEKDVFVASILIDMYSKYGSMQDARRVFDNVVQRDSVSWNSLMLGYVENGEGLMALELMASMDCLPDSFTLVAALKACASIGALEMGERVHNQAHELGLDEEEIVANCLVDFYGKCGNMAGAEEVFNKMHSKRSIVSWNALIGGYTSLGDTSHVFAIAKKMQEHDVRMDSVTMLLILTACSHAGMVEEGERYFSSIVCPTLEHYTCMTNMLGRANRLHEALSLVRHMPFKANSHVWMTLLGACRKWSNVEVGRVAFDALVSQNTNKDDITAACVLMRDIYKRLGMQQEYI